MNLGASIRIFVLCAFGASLDLSISATQIGAALLLIDWAWRAASKEKSGVWKAADLDFPIVLFFLWTGFTGIFRHSITMLDFLRNQSAFLLFFWAAQALDDKSTRRLLRWLCIGAALAGALGILQALFKINYLPDQRTYVVPAFFKNWPECIVHKLSLNNERAQGPRTHPLTYAESFIPGFFLLLGGLAREIRSARPSFLKMVSIGFGLALVVGGILLAQGRAVWLGLGLGLLVFACAVGRRFFFITVLLFGFALAVVAAVSPRIRGRFLSVASSSGGITADQQSKAVRFTLWRQAVEGILSHPVVGVGLEGARLTSIDPISHEQRVWTETHNLFLQFALELGLIGLGIFAWILVIIGRMVYRAAPDWRPAFAGMFVAFLVAGLTESWPKDKSVAMLFWLLIGNLAFLNQNRNEKI